MNSGSLDSEPIVLTTLQPCGYRTDLVLLSQVGQQILLEALHPQTGVTQIKSMPCPLPLGAFTPMTTSETSPVLIP